MGYGEPGEDVILWSFRCISYECYHAVVLIKTKEFANSSVSLNTTAWTSSVKTYKGAIVDGAAGASDRYPIKSFWCSATDYRAGREPNWLAYESL